MKVFLPKVEAAVSVKKTVPYYLEGIGHVRAYNSAKIKSQVEGYLLDVHYEQGDFVKENELLVTIDPVNYEAKVKEMQGMLLQTKAQLQFAEEKVMRFTKLVEDDYVSKLNYDEYVSNFEALLGTFKRDEGSLENAKANLDYCFIKAPFSGRIGKRLVDKGNLIGNDGSTLLVVNQIQPIYVDFSLPEKELTRILKGQKEGNLQVKVLIPEVMPIEEVGELIVVGNMVDRQTGMIPLRAQCVNQEEMLWPGQFAKVRLVLEEIKDAVLVPETAISLGQKGTFVLTIDSNNVATVKYVKTGEIFNDLIVITEGLEAGEKVVTNGQLNVKPGTAVDVVALNSDLLKDFKEW